MDKQDTNHSSHRSGADQEQISVLELLCRGQLKDEAIVYTCLSPCKGIAAVEEQVQKNQAKHAAKTATLSYEETN